jgi:tetratricopeptide (TPR) repeat protein
MSIRKEVFISATSADLGSYRQVAKDALLTLGAHPVEEQNFSTDYRELHTLLARRLDPCDAMIHLVGFHYGGEPNRSPNIPRRSWTQWEYYCAAECEHSRAVALGAIARLLTGKGEVDAALRLHEEAQAIFESLGDKSWRAFALGEIARLRADKGEVLVALQFHEERLRIYEALGDLNSTTNALWSIGQIELRLQHFQQAFEYLASSYNIALELGRLDAISYVGQDFGSILCTLDNREKGLAILESSRDGFVKLSLPENALYVQSIIDEIQSK